VFVTVGHGEKLASIKNIKLLIRRDVSMPPKGPLRFDKEQTFDMTGVDLKHTRKRDPRDEQSIKIFGSLCMFWFRSPPFVQISVRLNCLIF